MDRHPIAPTPQDAGRQMVHRTVSAQHFYVFILGLPEADPNTPLVRVRLQKQWMLNDGEGEAVVAATAPSALRIRKDHVQVGTITFTGLVGLIVMDDINYLFPAGSLFELYPPAVIDATLDEVSMQIPVTVG